MGRPPKSASEKRVQVNVRLLPADRDSLAELAEQNGRPLASEAEAVIAAALERRRTRSPETEALLDRIAEKIADMERAAKGRWHVKLTAWAAVSQMLKTVLDTDRPDKMFDDEVVVEAFTREQELRERREALQAELGQLGLSVQANPLPLFYSEQAHRRSLFGGLANRPPESTRKWEQQALEAMPEDYPFKQRASELFEELCALDTKIEAAAAAMTEACRPYFQAEEEGRKIAGLQPQSDILALLAGVPRIAAGQ